MACKNWTTHIAKPDQQDFQEAGIEGDGAVNLFDWRSEINNGSAVGLSHRPVSSLNKLLA
jgi:hypothetical protein